MPGGRRPNLNKAIHDRIVKVVRTTGHYADACRAAGIGVTTFTTWRNIGAAVNDPDHPDHPPTPNAHQKRCGELAAAVVAAEGEWATATREAIERAGSEPARKVVKIRRQVLDRTGQVVETEEEREEMLPPDWRARAFLLDRHSPPKQALEVTGADGGPVVVDVQARAEQVRAFLAGLRGDQAQEGGDDDG